ncbi:hypothetical protein MNBD_GAMMA02-813 [hydrothermal vent metagenome]|uniref:Uncharacterized protein n=1 Tax=hydrothermal vent metagenome TaxID=652676 RepID=A0A3B0W4L6_9ZZZZ
MSQRSLLLFALGLLALACYAVGLKTGTMLIFVLALCVELWFWYKFLAIRKKQNSKTD